MSLSEPTSPAVPAPWARSVAEVPTSASGPARDGTPLPLPEPGWGPMAAQAALAQARSMLDVELPEATVVSALTTVVLRSGGFAVKVYPPGTDAGHLDDLRAALRGSRTAHLPVTAPVTTTHGVLTVTPWLPRIGPPVTWGELGALLRAFHTDHAAATVPVWTPLSRLEARARALPHDAGEVLGAARTRLLDELAATTSHLGDGVIHGDVSPSNVMRAPDGARLIDLDWVARAPREYDLTSASRRFRAGELPADDYHAFCDGYGFDVCSWPGLRVLDRIADLGGVAFRLWDSVHHGRDLDWLPAELQVWQRLS